jgi:hypothetical protein
MTLISTLRLPVRPGGSAGITLIHDAFDRAVQLHESPVETLKMPVPPAGATARVLGVTE